MSGVTVLAPAKVNLELSVLGRRADGMHEVRTVLAALDHGDRVHVERRSGEGIELVLGGEALGDDVPRGPGNLAVRGAEVALEEARLRGLATGGGLGITLEKRLPSRAGLGGGSSDAAAACLGAARVLGLDPEDPAVEAALGRALGDLGADVPFFFLARRTGLALGEGRGERLRVLPRPAPWAVLVLTPEVGCPTAEVYAALGAAVLDDGALERARAGRASSSATPWHAEDLAAARAALVNDLEPAALSAVPALRPLRADLDAAAGAHFRLAGSGSSFFGLFPDRGAAQRFLGTPGLTRIARDHGLRARFVSALAGCGVREESP